jgi:hypothetical protein
MLSLPCTWCCSAADAATLDLHHVPVVHNKSPIFEETSQAHNVGEGFLSFQLMPQLHWGYLCSLKGTVRATMLCKPFARQFSPLLHTTSFTQDAPGRNARSIVLAEQEFSALAVSEVSQEHVTSWMSMSILATLMHQTAVIARSHKTDFKHPPAGRGRVSTTGTPRLAHAPPRLRSHQQPQAVQRQVNRSCHLLARKGTKRLLRVYRWRTSIAKNPITY